MPKGKKLGRLKKFVSHDISYKNKTQQLITAHLSQFLQAPSAPESGLIAEDTISVLIYAKVNDFSLS
ncbi:hypothetical protein GCM10022392_33790 [Mucilaginibacter panaciglaebae]|uniref:Uncharacterized protein n=1 Tax=Mucilaginibacter panaciglaebae TaxID=502331 RepID=A0ABP7X5H9_9SPHI